MKEDHTSVGNAQQGTALTPTEIQAIFRLVFRRPVPAPTEHVSEAEAALFMVVGLLRVNDFDPAVVLTVAARMWAWLEDDDTQAMMFHMIDRRYVGWNYRDQQVLIDMKTGDDVPADQPVPRVGESIAYDPYEMFRRRIALVLGERTSFWEGKDATDHTARSKETEVGGGLGEPQVLRDDAASPLS